MHQIIEALCTVLERQAGIAVAALQVPKEVGLDPSSSGAPSDTNGSVLSEAGSVGDLPPPGP